MNRYVPLIIVAVLLVTAGGFFIFQDQQQSVPSEKTEEFVMEGKENQQMTQEEGSLPVEEEKEETPTFSFIEVGKHNSSNDCWLAIHGKVYDVTEFISSHPGGKALLEGCGKDATGLYETRPMGSGKPHSQKARDLLPKYYVGDLE